MKKKKKINIKKKKKKLLKPKKEKKILLNYGEMEWLKEN